jgi:hypothetical protein
VPAAGLASPPKFSRPPIQHPRRSCASDRSHRKRGCVPASRNIGLADNKNSKPLDSIEANINQLFLKTGRPGGYMADDGGSERIQTAPLAMTPLRFANPSPPSG